MLSSTTVVSGMRLSPVRQVDKRRVTKKDADLEVRTRKKGVDIEMRTPEPSSKASNMMQVDAHTASPSLGHPEVNFTIATMIFLLLAAFISAFAAYGCAAKRSATNDEEST